MAYFAYSTCHLAIATVDPVEKAGIGKYLDTGCEFSDMDILGDYLLTAAGECEVVVIDVGVPWAERIINTIHLPSGGAGNTKISGEYAYVRHYNDFYILHIDPIESASLIASLHLEGIIQYYTYNENVMIVSGL